MLHTLYLLNLASNFRIAVSHPEYSSALHTFICIVDDISKKCLLDCYGKISDFTTPFFTLYKLMTISNAFKVHLPQQNEIIFMMMHKHVSTEPFLVLIYYI